MIGNNRIGAAAYTSTPAIVQAAKRNCAWYKNEIKRLAAEVTKNAHEYRKAVSEFKESSAWKEEFKTWGDASREVLDLSPQRSNQLIRELTENYYEVSESPLSDSPAKKLPPKSHITDPEPPQSEAKEEPEKPAVHSADEKKQDAPKTPPKPEPVKDTSGHPIPKALLPVWERRQEIQDVITLASKLKCAVEKLQGDKQFAAMVTVQTHLQSLGNLYFQLSQCKPGVVCPNCNGTLKDDMARECKSCRLTGFISEHDWHSQWQKSNGSHQIGKVQERCNSSSATTN